MTKKIINIAVICFIAADMILFLAAIAYFQLPGYLDYRENRIIVKDYMKQEHTDVNYSLKKIYMGESKFMSGGRANDEFLYYDRDNEFYFRIECSEGEILSDGYDKCFDGKQIISEIKKECGIDDDKALMHAQAQKLSDDTYSYVTCEAVVFSKDDTADYNTAYEMYRYMDERCGGGVRYILSFANDDAKKEYKSWYTYKREQGSSDLPHITYCVIESDDKISDLQEFITFAEKYHEKWKSQTSCS